MWKLENIMWFINELQALFLVGGRHELQARTSRSQQGNNSAVMTAELKKAV